MGGSWRIGTFWGIPLKVHWTFSLLLIYILAVGRMEGLTGTALMWFVVLFISLFICVILHEYGHALAARSYGVRTADILILPVGGLARLERLPEKPIQELVVAIAGPAVNLGLMFIGFLYLWLSGGDTDVMGSMAEQPQPSGANLVPQLILINGALFAFNLIPAFPMDGGRIFRSLLSMVLPKTTATEWATRLGMVVSVIFIITGIYSGNLVLALVGLVVLFLARSENRAVKLMDDLTMRSARDIMETSFVVMDEWTPVSEACEQISGRPLRWVIVRDVFGKWTGQVPVASLKELSTPGENSLFQIMEPFEAQLSSDLDIRHVVLAFQESESNVLPVLDGGKYLGIILRDRIIPYEMMARVSQ